MASVYDIAVKLHVASNHKEVLGSLLGMLGTTDAAVKRLVTSLGGMKGVLAGVGGALAFAGGVKAAAILIAHGDTLLHQQSLMMQAGMDQADIARATGQAWKTSQEAMGSNIADNMKSLRELRGVFGDHIEVPMAHLTELTRAQQVIAALLPHHNADEDVFNMAKALEMKGVSMDPEHFDKLLNEMVKASIAMGGKINGGDFMSAMKFGRTAALGWDDKFMGSILPTLMQEFKGGGGLGASGAMGPGNALMSAFQEVVGGTMSNKVAAELHKMGLLDMRKVIKTKTGNIKGVGPGGVEGSAEFEANPYQWVQDVLVPALKAHGVITDDAMRQEISHLFGVRTAQQIISMFATQQQRFQKDAVIIAGAKPIDEAKKISDATDPTQIMKNFTQAWTNLLTALGEPLARAAIPVMQDLTAGLNAVSRAARDYPEIGTALEAIGLGIAAWGGLAAVLKAATAVRGLFALLKGAQAVASVPNMAAAGPSLLGVAAGLTALIAATVGAKMLLDGASNKVDQFVMGRTDAEQEAKNKLLEKMHNDGWEQFKSWFGFGAPPKAPDDAYLSWMKNRGPQAPAIPPPAPTPRPPAAHATAAPQTFDDYGRPVPQLESYKAPVNVQSNVTVTPQQVTIQLDGRTVGQAVAKYITAALSLPNAGATRFDTRIAPGFPADTAPV